MASPTDTLHSAALYRLLLYALHWLPFTLRIDFKILVLTFKAILSSSRIYFRVFALILNTCLLHRLSAKTRRKTFDDRMFAAAARAFWNKLPSSNRGENNFTSFKTKLY